MDNDSAQSSAVAYTTTLKYVARLYTGVNTYEDVDLGSQVVNIGAMSKDVPVSYSALTGLLNDTVANQTAAGFTAPTDAAVKLAYISDYNAIPADASQTVATVAGQTQTVVFRFTK